MPYNKIIWESGDFATKKWRCPIIINWETGDAL